MTGIGPTSEEPRRTPGERSGAVKGRSAHVDGIISTRIPSDFSHLLLVTGSRSWDHESAMREAFNAVWTSWGPSNVLRPVLLSGHAPRGADAMAESLWREAGLEVIEMPADWSAHGRAAGPRRNQRMVDAADVLRAAGVRVDAVAFLDACGRGSRCLHGDRQQLLPGGPSGHFSHGTIDCRSRAHARGIPVRDVLAPR